MATCQASARLLLSGWLCACAPAELYEPDASQPEQHLPVTSAEAPSGFTLGRFTTDARRPTGLRKNECAVVDAVERLLQGAQDVVHCGDLPKYATASMRRDAQRCVLAAYRAGRPFRLTWESYSYDSHDSAGVAARDASSVHYVSRSSVPVASWVMQARLGIASFNGLGALAGCDFETYPCFDLEGGRSMYEGCEKLETF